MVTANDYWDSAQPVYLIMSDADHHKYYFMVPQTTGWVAVYGRIGKTQQKHPYHNSRWNIKLVEKLDKGYSIINQEIQDSKMNCPACGSLVINFNPESYYGNTPGSNICLTCGLKIPESNFLNLIFRALHEKS